MDVEHVLHYYKFKQQLLNELNEIRPSIYILLLEINAAFSNYCREITQNKITLSTYWMTLVPLTLFPKNDVFRCF